PERGEPGLCPRRQGRTGAGRADAGGAESMSRRGIRHKQPGQTTPSPPTTFAGWHRARVGSPWTLLVPSAESWKACWLRLVAAVRGKAGDMMVLAAGTHP